MKVRITTILLILLMLVSSFVSCESGDTDTTYNEDTGTVTREYVILQKDAVICDDAEKAKYYCPDIFNPTAVPCRVNIETGEIQYACPVKDCDHKGKDCYYYNMWVKSVYETGNYLIMNVLKYPSGSSLILAYEWKTGTMLEVNKKSKTIDQLIPGVYDGLIYGYSSHASSDLKSSVSFYAIDLYSGEITKTHTVKDNLTPLFAKEGVIYGLNTNGAFTLSVSDETPSEYKLPDGCEGFKLHKPDVLYKTDAPAAIYDIKSKKTVYPDPATDITSPVSDGEYYYCQSRGGVETAKKNDGTEVNYVRYDNIIYRQSLDGETEKYTVDTDYHFIIYAAQGDYVIGRLMYKYSDGVYTPFEELEHDHIRINIKTKEIQLLDLYFEHDYFL